MKRFLRTLAVAALLAFCVITATQAKRGAETKDNNEMHWSAFDKDKLIQTSFNNQIDATKPMVALTFDDGPGKYTDRLLDVLEKYDARATFFMVGKNISAYPETVQRMKSLGCEYGNHTMNHKELTKEKADSIKKQIEKTDQALYEITGDHIYLVRPPYGSENAKVHEAVEAPFIMWSVDTWDWQRKNAKIVEEYVLHKVKDGDIVLLHDIHKTTVEAAEKFIPQLIEDGYQLVTVSELARARGVKLADDDTYYAFYPE